MLQDAASVNIPHVKNVNRMPFRRDEQDKIRARLREHLRKRVGLTHELPTLPGVQSLSIATRYIEGGRDRFIEFVQAAMLNGSEPATKWMIVFTDLTPTQRLTVSYDDVCAASGVKPSEIIAAVTSTAVEIGIDVGNLVAALTHPQVVAAAVAAAKDKSGVADRQMLFQHSGFLPVPKNVQPSTIVNVSASAQAQSAAQATSQSGGVPSFADDLKLVGQGKLPARVAQAALPAAEAPEDLTFDADGDQDFDYADEELVPEPVMVVAGDHES